MGATRDTSIPGGERFGKQVSSGSGRRQKSLANSIQQFNTNNLSPELLSASTRNRGANGYVAESTSQPVSSQLSCRSGLQFAVDSAAKSA